MATTAVFAEILVIGLQVEAWILLAAVTVFGSDWIDLAELGDFASLLTVLVVALAYVLGVVFDRIADTALDRFEETGPGQYIKNRFTKNREEIRNLAKMRMLVMHRSDGMTRFLDYQRTRWRIARATVLNIAIATPIAAMYIAFGAGERLWAIGALVCGFALLPIVYFAGVRVQDAWVKRLVDAHTIVSREQHE